MTTIATESTRFGNVVKSEYDPASGFCRDNITFNGTATTLQVGTVLGSYLASPTATAGTTVGTGNGTMGSITMSASLGLQIGTYTLKITKTVSNAGDFVLLDPQGQAIGIGQVGTAFSQAGFAFTLADGSTDFVVGDYIPITVTGTKKYKIVEASATDGSQVAAAIYIADALGLSQSSATTLNTDLVVLAITKGPAIVNKSQLTFGASVTGTALTAAYAQLDALGIRVATQA